MFSVAVYAFKIQRMMQQIKALEAVELSISTKMALSFEFAPPHYFPSPMDCDTYLQVIDVFSLSNGDDMISLAWTLVFNRPLNCLSHQETAIKFALIHIHEMIVSIRIQIDLLMSQFEGKCI